jgi:FlgD Ig-like domain
VRIQKQFSTACPLHANVRCRTHTARLSFRLRAPGRIALAIVDGSGRVVDRLGPAGGARRPRGRVTVGWNGETSSGATAADGTYHLRVDLLTLGRTITIPDPIGLDDTAPTIRLVGRPGRLPLRYRTSERAVVFVHADGIGSATGRAALFRGHGGSVHFRHTRLAGAQVRITLVAVDPAGNASAPLDAGVIRLPS